MLRTFIIFLSVFVFVQGAWADSNELEDPVDLWGELWFDQYELLMLFKAPNSLCQSTAILLCTGWENHDTGEDLKECMDYELRSQCDCDGAQWNESEGTCEADL